MLTSTISKHMAVGYYPYFSSDFITIGAGIEYTEHPVKLIQSLDGLLKPNKRVFITMLNDDDSKLGKRNVSYDLCGNN